MDANAKVLTEKRSVFINVHVENCLKIDEKKEVISMHKNKHETIFSADMNIDYYTFSSVIYEAMNKLMNEFYQNNDEPLFWTFKLECFPVFIKGLIGIKMEMDCSDTKTAEQMMFSPSFIETLKSGDEAATMDSFVKDMILKSDHIIYKEDGVQ